MTSKVILFCVLLFCSKIVDSIPHSDDLNRQRENPLPTWNVNQNVQKGQYLDTDLNIQQEKTQDYNTNPGRYNYNNKYNISPVSLSAGQGGLVGYDSSLNEGGLDSSQATFGNQQYRKQNWQSQNQYPVQSSVFLPDNERLPVQYKQPDQRFYQLRPLNKFQPLTGDKYFGNSGSFFGSSGSIPYTNIYSESQGSASQRKARPSEDLRYVQSSAFPHVPQSGIIYNQVPAADTLTGQSEINEYAENNYRSRNTALLKNYDDGSSVKPSNDPVPYESYREKQAIESEVQSRIIEAPNYALSSAPKFERIYDKAPATNTMKHQPKNMKNMNFDTQPSHLINAAPIKNHGDSSLLISDADNNNSDFRLRNPAHVNSNKEAPIDISKKFSEGPLARIISNYKSDHGWNNVARDDSSNGVTETVPVISGNYEANHGYDYGLNYPAPINTHSGAFSAPTDKELLNSGNNKYEKSKVTRHRSGNPTALNTNPNSRIVEHKLMTLAANSKTGNQKRSFVVVHPNRTVEYLNRRDIDKHPDSKLRLVNTTPKSMDDSDSDRVVAQKSPKNLPNIIKTPVPVGKYPLTTNNQLADVKKTTPLHVDQANPASDSNMSPRSKDLPADNSNLKALPQPEQQPADNNNSKPLNVIPPASDDNSKPLSPNEDQSKPNDNLKPLPKDDYDSKPLTPHVNQSAADGNSKPLPQDGTHRKHHDKLRSHVNKTHTHRHGHKPAEDNNSNLSTTPKLLTYPEAPQGNGDDFKSLPAHTTQSANDTKSKPSHGDQGGDDNNLTPSSPHENQPEEDNKSKPLRGNGNQPTDDINSESTPAVVSNNDDQSYSTTVSATEPNYTTSTKPQVTKTHTHNIHRKSTTYSPVVSTTPCTDDTSKDQIITLSPIEQATDNVSDIPLVATTTTTTRPNQSSGKSDIINDANNNQDDVHDDTAQIYSTTTISPSSSASPTDIISDDKTIGTIENKNTQTNDKPVVDQVNGEKDTAVYNSSELFDTNTDVPAESDDYSSVTASPSVQNDVNTGDASGDNALELGYSETDVTITVSSNTANDSEDEILTINIEVSESTDDADSSSNDKSLVVKIDTNDGGDDDSKTPKPEDRKKDHNSNYGRGNNVEIDMSNLKGEPTMWIRTTNQDFIDKLTAKNDTEFDLIYFFHIENLPAIEREKATTIYCNGTVVTEITEITYAHKDDATPTIVKTTKTTQNEDYEPNDVVKISE